ncbi:hypothetical protein QBA38_43750 [Streptomyces stelliscabiei]
MNDSSLPDRRATSVVESCPLGATTTLAELARDPHPRLALLRAREPVSWVPELDGWLVTRRDLALSVMQDAATFTVDDPRFSTAQIVGPSMLLARRRPAHPAPQTLQLPLPTPGRA